MAYISHSVTTEVDASLFVSKGLAVSSVEPPSERKPMDGVPQTTLPEEIAAAIVQSSEKLEGAASILAMLEDKAENRRITASELSAVRCIVEKCAADLDRAWERA